MLILTKLINCLYINDEADKKVPITLNNVIYGFNDVERFNGTWISHNEFIYRNLNEIIIFNCDSNTFQIIADDVNLVSVKIFNSVIFC